MKIEAEFVKSAAAAGDLPRDGIPQIAMVGRSNVGKSSLINALVRRIVARTSAAPGKTRLANIYAVARGASRPFYLVDLPGYGYARGGADSAREFDALARIYFGQVGPVRRVGHADLVGRVGQDGSESFPSAAPVRPAQPAAHAPISAIFLVDSRHPGLASDLEAWTWMKAAVGSRAIAATKIDKLARGERIRALRELQSVFDNPVVPVSAATGEGLDELWKLIDKLNNSHPTPRNRSREPLPAPPARNPPLRNGPTSPPTDPRTSRPSVPPTDRTNPPRSHRKRSSGSTWRR